MKRKLETIVNIVDRAISGNDTYPEKIPEKITRERMNFRGTFFDLANSIIGIIYPRLQIF